VADEETKLNNLIGQMDNYFPIDWEDLLEDVAANPEKYRHPEQDAENETIGIGTDGKPVNMDLWVWMDVSGFLVETGYNLGIIEGSQGGTAGYDFNELEDGAIKGTVPAYIMEKNSELKPVTGMDYTFVGCTGLAKAPIIPDTVVSMTATFAGCTSIEVAPVIPQGMLYLGETFANCTSLEVAPKIPNKVSWMRYTFYNCTNLKTVTAIPESVTHLEYAFAYCKKLTGTIEINAIPENSLAYQYCFKDAALTEEGSSLIVTKSSKSTAIDEIIATKSANSNITKETTE